MFWNYIESYLPIEVWKGTKCVFGDNRLHFNVVKSEYHDKEWFEKSGPFYKDAALHPERFQTEYEIKKFAMMAIMIPAVAHPWATGVHTTKANAIKWAMRRYPATIPWVDMLTRMRAENDFTYAPLQETVDMWNIINGSGK